MFDTIIYIPTIMAYAFISLLVLILSFIVVYISHKIYICIYDILPTSRYTSLEKLQTKDNGKRTSQLLTIKDESGYRRSKTAMTIIVSFEPTYLAYVAFETQHSTEKYAINNETETANFLRNKKLIKYFDRLSAIPTCKALLDCAAHDSEAEKMAHAKDAIDALLPLRII